VHRHAADFLKIKILFVACWKESRGIRSQTITKLFVSLKIQTNKMARYDFAQSLAGLCEKVLRSAKDLAGKNYAFLLGRQTGALDFILSPDNGGLKAEYVQKANKIVQTRLTYKRRTKPCEILTGTQAKETGICDTAYESEEKEVTVSLDDRIATQPRKFTNDRMMQICQDTDSFIQEFLMSDMRALREKLDEIILARMATDIGYKIRQNGTTVGQDQYTDVQLLGTVNAQPYPLMGNYQAGLIQDYYNMQFNGVPAIIGQGNLQTFFGLANMACCNSANISYEASKAAAGAAFFVDQAANSILGANRFIMAAFGASHLLWFNKNRSINIDTPTNKHIVVPDPVYPRLSWDLDFKWDECDEVWIYQISAFYDTFNVFQGDSFATQSGGATSPDCTDELWGVTGLWGYRATSA
jgi:hypothetical protein